MKNFTQATLIALLISSSAFSQTKDEPVKNPTGVTVINQASNNQLILLSPADGRSFNSSEGSKPVLFRWTAISPKPKEAVTYRLRVWQLMQGQNGTAAMKNNQPIITKDVVNITQAAISNLYTGPCKPPYLCDFVWGIEVLNNDGVTIGNSYTASSSFKFEAGNAVAENEGNKGNAGNSGMSGGKSLDAQGDPVHGVDVKLGASQKRNIKNPENVKSNSKVLDQGDKQIDKSFPGVKSTSAQGDPVHGVDVKLGMKKQDNANGKEKGTKSTNTTSWDVQELKKG